MLESKRRAQKTKGAAVRAFILVLTLNTTGTKIIRHNSYWCFFHQKWVQQEPLKGHLKSANMKELILKTLSLACWTKDSFLFYSATFILLFTLWIVIFKLIFTGIFFKFLFKTITFKISVKLVQSNLQDSRQCKVSIGKINVASIQKVDGNVTRTIEREETTYRRNVSLKKWVISLLRICSVIPAEIFPFQAEWIKDRY